MFLHDCTILPLDWIGGEHALNTERIAESKNRGPAHRRGEGLRRACPVKKLPRGSEIRIEGAAIGTLGAWEYDGPSGILPRARVPVDVASVETLAQGGSFLLCGRPIIGPTLVQVVGDLGGGRMGLL